MNENNDIVVELLICDAVATKPPPNAENVLSRSERERLAGMTNEHQARLFLLGRYLLRQRLGRLLQREPAAVDIHLSERGKPVLKHHDWQFNLSHSGSLLALALSPLATVGVDLESRLLGDDRISRLSRRYLTPAEQDWLLTSPDAATDFQRLWTIKEAVLKADGSGIANNLGRVEWQPGEPQARFDGRPYHLYQGRLHTTSLTLAVAGSPGRIRQLTLADCAPALEITGPQPNLAINP